MILKNTWRFGSASRQTATIVTSLNYPYGIRRREMKLANFETGIRVCVLLNSGRYAEGCVPRRKESARYKRHTRGRIPATQRYSFEKRPPVDKSANLASLLWRCTSRNVDNVDLRDSLSVPPAGNLLSPNCAHLVNNRDSLANNW